MKREGLLIALVSFLMFTSYKTVPKKMFGIKTVVIDAGHGGHDVGCLGSSAKEKNIALSISLKLGEMIEQKLADVRVIFTRKKDEFIELHERAAIANRAKADLFICIHCNSACVRNSNGKESCNEAIHGIETYVMGLHKTEDNLSVSRRENASVLLEKDYKTKYDGFDPNSPEANIIFTLFQNAYMNQSISFASKIQTEIQDYAGRTNRGVKQAGFLVLYRTAMPSVLIETGFLTSPSEERYLLSEKGQADIASSIFKAFREYKIDMESDGIQEPEKKEPESNPAVTIPEAKTPGQKDTMVEKENKKDTLPITRKEKKEEENSTKENKIQVVNDSTLYSPPVTVKAEPKKEPAKKIISEKPAPSDNTGFFYTVQIGAAPANAKTGLERYNTVNDLKKITGEDGIIRFTAGNFQNLNDAINLQTSLRNEGFKDAFVTAYFNNKRITLQEAAKLSKKN